MPNQGSISTDLTAVIADSQANNSLLNKGISLENVSAGHIRKTSSSAAYETVLQVGGSGFVSGRLVTGALSGATAEMRMFDNSVADANKIGHGFAGANSAVCASCDNANFGNGLIVQLKSDGTNPVEGLITIIPSKPAANTEIDVDDTNHIYEAGPTDINHNTASVWLRPTGGTRRRGLLLFDLSNEPFGREIESATLEMQVTAESNFGATYQIDLHRILVEYTPSQASWNERQSGNPWNSPGLASGTDYEAAVSASEAGPLSSNTIFTMDLTSLIQGYINGDYVNYGFFLKLTPESGFDDGFLYAFPSGAGLTPNLTITYK